MQLGVWCSHIDGDSCNSRRAFQSQNIFLLMFTYFSVWAENRQNHDFDKKRDNFGIELNGSQLLETGAETVRPNLSDVFDSPLVQQNPRNNLQDSEMVSHNYLITHPKPAMLADCQVPLVAEHARFYQRLHESFLVIFIWTLMATTVPSQCIIRGLSH